jgi:(4-(4-[2-(gamma-L-glutamylamino)ethyl]phenoxymethyl)furan-2-yl)methanamine synthase
MSRPWFSTFFGQVPGFPRAFPREASRFKSYLGKMLRAECVVGWDIGGAHVKVAVLRGRELINAAQVPCPLWQGISRLEEAVDQILRRIPGKTALHAVTMTGELVDCFTGRDQGVGRILQVLRSRISPESLFVFAGGAGLLDFDSVNSEHYAGIASANWLATAVDVARAVNAAVLLDIGSTTTDILLMQGGKVRPQGYSDYERLLSSELVYTGVVRTPIAAVAKRALFEGHWVPLMAEMFATTADVYRLSGELNEAYDPWPAADGAEKTREGSARRLARMIGRDLESASLESWVQLAGFFREHQLREIQIALMRQLSRLVSDRPPIIVGAGVGRFLTMDLCARLGFDYLDYSGILDANGTIPGAAECAPAVSVARMLAEQA